jgi:hypothetical protein
MSGYPYGNPNGAGYPPSHAAGYNAYPNYPVDNHFQASQPPTMPSMSNYNDHQSCASLYGSPAPVSNNHSYSQGASYNAYDGSQMSNTAYGANTPNNYPPSAGGLMSHNMYHSAPQQHGGKKDE